MNEAAEWNHLELLLRVTRELDINVLLIDQPINGLLSDQQGVTPAARRAYYDKVRQLATRYRVALRDFSGYEEDHYLLHGRHSSERGSLGALRRGAGRVLPAQTFLRNGLVFPSDLRC